MRRHYFILITTVFILSGLDSQEQIALNFNRSMAYHPVIKGGSFTALEGNTFDNRPGTFQASTITADMLPGPCDKTISVDMDEGTILCNLVASNVVSELVKKGKDLCGAWGPWVWGDCKHFVRNGFRIQNCNRTDVYQDKHVCSYFPTAFGVMGTVEETHLHGGPYNVFSNWVEEENEYEFCGSWSLAPELNNALATVSSGKELAVNYTAGKANVVAGSPVKVTEDQNLPSQFASVTYNIDGLDVTTGQSVLMNFVGEHTITATINTKSGGVVKFTIPFSVIKPVTVEEITQKTLNNGEIQYSIKILNNNVHSGVAWVSTSMLNKPGYVADIQGARQYNLTEGNSAIINVLLHPVKLRRINPDKPETPVSFDFIVSTPTANGLIMDKKTVTAQTAAISIPGGIAGNDGPQQVRTISVKTISGEVVEVKIPNNIRPGDHISGSVATKTQSSTLEGAVVDVENKKTNVKDKLFSFIVPAGLASIPFIIRDNNGGELARTNIPINVPNLPKPGNNVTVPPQQIEMPPQHAPGSFAPMNYCQPGQPLTINGFFDGNAANTSVSINNIPCEVLAESDRGSFANIPDNLPAGKASLTIQEGGVTQTMSIQVITTNLSANKTVVQKGTKAKVTATVKGLENLDLNNNNFKIEITNESPGVIQFMDVNATTITRDINSSNVKNGTFTFTTDITGTATGSYTVGSNVTSNTCTNCWRKYTDCIDNCEAEEKKCYDACDKSNKGFGCYLACSAAARLCEAACWTEYLNCVRQKLGY